MKKIVMFVVISLFFAAHLSAETVMLKTGQRVEGKITERTDKYVKMDFQGVELVYYQDEIASITDEGRSTTASGKELGLKPAYAPINFSALAEHYPVASELESSEGGDFSEGAIGEGEFGGPIAMPAEGLDGGVKQITPANLDISSATASLPPEYQQMIKSIQDNPQDISSALSKLPAEYRSAVEGAMKNMPQVQAASTDVRKE